MDWKALDYVITPKLSASLYVFSCSGHESLITPVKILIKIKVCLLDCDFLFCYSMPLLCYLQERELKYIQT